MGAVKECLANNIDEAATQIASSKIRFSFDDLYDELWKIWEEYDVFETEEFVQKYTELHNGASYEREK